MKLAYYWKLIKGKTQALNPAKLDIRHLWAVFQSWVRCKLPTPKHVKEQIIWRRGEVILKSPECWKQGACIQCGCFILGKTMADMACEDEPFCYPAMMKKREWQQFKKDNKIELFK